MIKLLGAVALVLVATAAGSRSAEAYWVRGGWGWRAPVVVVGPPVAYGPPGYAPYWVRPHYDRWGRWVPGHWR